MDEYDLKPGHDRFAFMERSVHDPSINFVLIVTDKSYCEKADNRSGGVGVETTIITQEVYASVNNEKFIPVAMEVDDQGLPYLPTYLKSRFSVILTQGLHDSAEYRKLVAHLWGHPIVPRPALGTRPVWLDLPAVDTQIIDRCSEAIGHDGSRSASSQSLVIRAAAEAAALFNDIPRQIVTENTL